MICVASSCCDKQPLLLLQILCQFLHREESQGVFVPVCQHLSHYFGHICAMCSTNGCKACFFGTYFWA